MSQPEKPIEQIFEHWIATCRPSGRRPVLDEKRRRKIRNALKHYTVEELKQAIDGNKASKWHQGANPRGKTYDELTLILRDAEHIEQFIELAEQDDLTEWLNT